jgi:hypothetical protein
MDTSSLFSSLKFGWNACFGGGSDENTDNGVAPAIKLTDKDIDIIIDRRRYLFVVTTINITLNEYIKYDESSFFLSRGLGDPSFDNDPKNRSNYLSEGQTNANDFVETVPLVSLRRFEGETLGNQREPIEGFYY